MRKSLLLALLLPAVAFGQASLQKPAGEIAPVEGLSIRELMMPLTDIHLYGHAEKELASNGDAQYVYIFSTVALFILVIACFNYMNLATARSTKRAKEVGMRKVLGAEKRSTLTYR